MENTTRTESVLVRLTKKEKERLEEEASEAGIPLSTFVYEKATGDTVSIETKRLESLIYQLQEDTANRIDNLETKIQENHSASVKDFGEFGTNIAKFLTSKFKELQADKPATQTVKKEEVVDELVNDKLAMNAKMFATSYYIGDVIHTNTGKLYEVVQNGEDSDENKTPNSIKVKEVDTGKVGPLSLNTMQTTIIKIERLKKNIDS